MSHSCFLNENSAQSTALFHRAAVPQKLAVAGEIVVVPQCAGECLCYRPVLVSHINLQQEGQQLLLVLFQNKNANTSVYLDNRCYKPVVFSSVSGMCGAVVPLPRSTHRALEGILSVILPERQKMGRSPWPLSGLTNRGFVTPRCL